jgi:hypothetical protein
VLRAAGGVHLGLELVETAERSLRLAPERLVELRALRVDPVELGVK